MGHARRCREARKIKAKLWNDEASWDEAWDSFRGPFQAFIKFCHANYAIESSTQTLICGHLQRAVQMDRTMFAESISECDDLCDGLQAVWQLVEDFLLDHGLFRSGASNGAALILLYRAC